MGQVPDPNTLEEILELKTLLAAEWPARTAALQASGVPLMEGDDDPDDDPDADPDADPDPQTFDAAYVKKLRDEAAKHRRDARDAQARVKEFEDKDKTDTERNEEARISAETRATAAERELARARVALRKGLTEAQAKRLIGDTEEDLEADADELLTTFQTSDDEQDSLRRTPRERLRPGAIPSGEPEETDPVKLAAMVPRRF